MISTMQSITIKAALAMGLILQSGHSMEDHESSLSSSQNKTVVEHEQVIPPFIIDGSPVPNEILVQIFNKCEGSLFQLSLTCTHFNKIAESLIYGKKSLDLAYNTQITDSILRKFTKLESLCLAFNGTITDHGISTLTNLKQLNLLWNSTITRTAVALLREHNPDLEVLDSWELNGTLCLSYPR